ncbi:hypothetical protein CHU32_10035 [Superficieibacter electus]|uniref:Uncharacterized protein n=1 Tax=Superficieibacter electus TaxID=2022662 RepID=A0A2P5GQS8_9ENTR|nr:hypothetical protein [Superficieibacter electus]POP43408.1 hypothetical protein CHU33_16150 [Superficieibacter electus]POP48923.1 hypothetical protein CHU32_10035 [Superficieibacter electus]
MATIRIEDIIRKLDNFECPYLWVNINNIIGIDKQAEKDKNRKNWYAEKELFDMTFSNGDYLTEYYSECLKEPGLIISLKQFLDVIYFMIVELGCHAPATFLIDINGVVINRGNASKVLNKLWGWYLSQRNDFVADILRDYILELFQIGSLWGMNGRGRFFNCLSKEENDKLNKLYTRNH